jgi:hypothetical protein
MPPKLRFYRRIQALERLPIASTAVFWMFDTGSVSGSKRTTERFERISVVPTLRNLQNDFAALLPLLEPPMRVAGLL